MAQRQEKSASFDALPTELLDSIVKPVIADSPQSLDNIAKVNVVFREAARRFSQTLVICKFKKQGKKKPPDPDDACTALAKELSLRPMLCNLVVERGAESGLWPALASRQWTSAKVIVEGEALERLWQVLYTSRDTLKRLDLDPGRHFPRPLADSVLNIAQAFPKLKSLMLNGGKAGDSYSVEDFCKVGGGFNLGSQASCLNELDVVSFKFTDWSDAIYRSLPLDLPSLTSLRLQCTTRKSMLITPRSTALQAAFARIQCLNLDVWSNSVPMSMLESIADHCPRLQQLVLHGIPPSRTDDVGSSKDSPGVLSRVLDKCPDLERLVMSEARVMHPKHFAWLVSERGLLPKSCLNIGDLKSLELALSDKIQILGYDRTDEPGFRQRRDGRGTRILFFYLMVPMAAPRWVRRGNPDLIKERMLGDPSTILKWLRDFVERCPGPASVQQRQSHEEIDIGPKLTVMDSYVVQIHDVTLQI